MGSAASPLFTGRGRLKARLTDQKMLLIGGAATVGVMNAPCLLAIALASRQKFWRLSGVFTFSQQNQMVVLSSGQFIFQTICLEINQRRTEHTTEASARNIADMQLFPGGNAAP